MKKTFFTVFAFAVFFTTAFFVSVPRANAFSLNGLFTYIKGFFPPSSQTAVTVTAKIDLAPNGDINHNGKIEAGDTLRFSYTLTNTTKTAYHFATLKTNIDTKVLNDINTVYGAISLDQDNSTIIIPNLTIDKNQVRKVSFDAQVNFDNTNYHTITTQPILVDQKDNTIATGSTQSVTAAKTDTTTFNKFVHITK